MHSFATKLLHVGHHTVATAYACQEIRTEEVCTQEIRGAEVDRDAAEREIAEFLERRLGAASGDEAWSAAARLRHGGRLPSTEVRP